MFCQPREYINHEKEKLDVSLTISSVIKLKDIDSIIQNSKQKDLQAKCIRCNKIMAENLSIFVTVYPPLKHPKYNASNSSIGNVKDTCSCRCGISKSFHASDTIDSDHVCILIPNRIINSLSSCDEECKDFCANYCPSNENGHNYSFASKPPPLTQKGPPCSDCHVSLVLDSDCDFCGHKLSLMLQIADRSTECFSKGSQTDDPMSVDVCNGVNTPNLLRAVAVVLEDDSELKGNLPGSEGYGNQLPELNAENEAAYQSHLKNLVPCSFCGRRFNPDRIMIHENACIEKPKKRKYITPDKDEKK